MQKDEALPSDLLIEPLQLKHLSMLKAENTPRYLELFSAFNIDKCLS